MDMTGKGSDVELQSGSDDPVNYHEPGMSSEWQINGNNLTNTSIGMIPNANSMAVSSTCSSPPTVDSCCLPIWDQPSSGRSMGYCDVKVQNGASTSNSLGHVRGEDWTSNAMYGGGMFLPTVPGMLPQGLPHFPADTAFIERAARFSCFSGGNFGEMMNPYSIPDPLAPYSRGLGLMQGNESNPQPGVQSQQHEMNRVEVSKETLLRGNHGSEGSPYKNEKKGESFVQSYDEAKYGAGVSGNESDEAEFSGQEELNGSASESPGKGLGSKKRKRGGKGAEHDENNEAPRPSVDTAKDTTEIKHQGDQNPTSTSKPGGKHGKQVSDPPKEEYIHVRARRGQATNSHSLAERVRREKISERMKFLQDLVPGCSKVTGKAVMLDEIINYVQSLQRQVEFLSMKLATVNPQLDFNIEAFLAKDIPRPRAGLSSSLAFPPDMTVPFPPLHPSQPGLIQAGLLGNSSETLRRPINIQSPAACGGYKEPPSQIASVWEDELHNVVHMGLNSSASHNSQDLNDSLPLGHMKAEP